ncbi:ester cyclase [Haladaptatus pallidirubidus]|uniref:SnoaL-like polyketide cyclase n=1 Tax=Haladaptatus pallidirubidus TaxID=1008152 RepID=A0AAV3UE11_9EURY|nr:ester cyclase [Haladaptatus pallidirubidus]
MTTETNQKLVRRDAEEIWSKGKTEIIDEIYDEDFVLHDPSSPNEEQGREEYREYVETFRRAFPDARYRVDIELAEDDLVSLRYTARGTHEGERVTVSGMEMYRVEDGNIVEMWTNYDALGLLQQLDVLPSLDELTREESAD